MSHPTESDVRMRAWAEISLSNLERNLYQIKAALPKGLRYIAVVKADAYGHGLLPVAVRLMRSGADMFAVANIAEAAELREIAGDWPILVLGPVLPFEMKAAIDMNLILSLSSREECESLARLAGSVSKSVAVHLKIDTGMGRAGVWYEQAGELLEAVRAQPMLDLQGIYTHFSCADSDPQFTAEQRQRFQAIMNQYGLGQQPLWVHADNSAGLDSFTRGLPVNGVRVGLLQFGVRPHPFSLLAGLQVEPVFSFHTRVGLIKTLPAGTGISYGRSHILPRKTRVAVLTSGYADGVPTTLSNRGHVLIRGRLCPVLGRVTMDQTVVDLGAQEEVCVGDKATWIGTQQEAGIDLIAFARQAGQIPWEVLCSVSKRVQRVYRTDSAL
ncbi:MAG: alanine racemase [Verrucomicrobia bacterium]|nr:alanine racemase [Verrucomicrobiota bacterium]